MKKLFNYYSNILSFLIKNTLYLFIELIIICIYATKLLSLLIKSNLFSKFSNSKKIQTKRNYLKIIIFKSGNLGDHLIAIDCLNFIQKKYDVKAAWIICKGSSKYNDLVKLGKYHNVNIYDYWDFLKLIPEISRGNFIIIDTQQKFRLALLISFLKGDNIFISLKSSFIDNFLKRYFRNIRIFKYNENNLEGKVLFDLITSGINAIREINISNKEKDYLFNIYQKTFLKISVPKINNGFLSFHDGVIKKFSNKKQSIYLYYGTSGKAIHRLAPFNWFKGLLRDLIEDFNIFLVGGKSEIALINNLNSELYSSSELINKFNVEEWSVILSNSKYKLPLLAFDGGFSHLYGIHSPYLFQIFCSSNSNKWRNKSNKAFVYDCLEGGSPNYKPHLFKVPDYCKYAEKAWEETHPNSVSLSFRKWVKKLKINN